MDNYAWRNVGLWLALCITTLAVLTSCGNKGNIGDLNQQASVAPTAAQNTGATQTITEDEVSSLPAWQQDLLADPGWNQPTIPQRADTPMPAPSYDMLLDWQSKAQAAALDTGSSKSSSWYGDTTPWQPLPTGVTATQAEYSQLYPGNPPQVPYGCPDGTTHGHTKEKWIAQQPIPQGANQPISYVLKGVSSPNQFNTLGGSGQNSLCAVYQIWCSSSKGNPQKAYTEYNAANPAPQFAEMSYRADGGPSAGGNPCNANTAFTVKDFIWWKYNATINALPGQSSTQTFNILIAPSSQASSLSTGANPGKTKGYIQYFYCGNLSSAYGGGAIVQLDSTSSTCTKFVIKDTAQGIDNRYMFTNPIYGVLLKRWQDGVVKSMQAPNNNPWNTDFGWPVQGPTAYNGGAQTLTGNGAYYAWGMYFERGFVWWIDYINNTNVPDEAQAYSYTGGNVFCKVTGDKYEKLPTIYYGGTGPLGVSVIVEASLNPDAGPTAPPAGTFYQVGNPVGGPATVLDMHAHGYGGAARATDGRYKFYTWAFRDGTIGVTNGTAYDDFTKYVQHSYATQSVYTVRVQVVDANGAVGYGDSLPIHVGDGAAGAGGGNPEVMLIRADNSAYGTQYTAYTDALTALGTPYAETTLSASTPTDFASSTAKVAIFFRGGPTNGGTTDTSPVSSTLTTAMNTILSSGSKRKVFLIAQSMSAESQTTDYGTSYYWKSIGGTGPIAPNVVNYTTIGQIDGYQNGYPGFLWGDAYLHWNAPTSWVGPVTLGLSGQDQSTAAERYVGSGSSGKVPTSVTIGSAQFTTRVRYKPYDGNFQVATSFINGLSPNYSNGTFGIYGDVPLSWGNSSAPGASGTGKYYYWGFSFKDISSVSPATMTKNDMLRNVLAWLDPTITFSAKTNGGFQEYSGNPEIVSVTPAYWDETNHNYVTGGPTTPWSGSGSAAGHYPDQSSTNVYRTSGGTSGTILTTDANNNWINGNDVDFQQTMYAYINRGVNGVLETGGTSPTFNNTDDTVFYAGVLVSDADGSWTRIATPATTPSIQLKEQANNTQNRNPIPVVCGYYQSSGSGTSADDIYANYGTDIDAFTATSSNWSNSSPLTMECLARWPATLKYFNWSGNGGQAPNAPDAYLVWQLYPGQGNLIPTGPNAGKFIGLNANWEESRSSFDIDVANGWTVTGRNNTSAWNRPSFSFQDPTSQGRAISFNFRKLKTWNGDQNRDGAINNQDKFPVRVRLFTDHKTYYDKVVGGTVGTSPNTGWPNHLANPGGDPATTPLASRNPSYLEGGAYIVDKGSPVYNVQITDDPNQPDPGALGTLTGQGPGSYTAKLMFLIKYGAPNYKVEADTWYTGVFAANNGVNTVLVKDFGTAPNTEGAYNITINVPAAQPNGNYNFAIKVTDGNGDTSIYPWPSLVGLFPQALLSEDFEDGTMNKWTIGGTVGQNYDGLRNMSMDWRNVTTCGYSKGYSNPYTGTTIGGNMTPPQGTRMGAFTDGSGDSNSASPISANRYIELTNAVPCTSGQVYTVSFKYNGIAYPETTGAGYTYGGIVPEISFNGGASWYNNNVPTSYNSNWVGSKIHYGTYPYDTINYYYGWAYAAGYPGVAGGTWQTATTNFTATGTSFKIRFRFWSYNGYYDPLPTMYYVTGPQAMDSILVQ